MRRTLLGTLLLITTAISATPLAYADGHGQPWLYELRTYTANPGKLEALHARFRNHTLALFEKHGMRNIGYWLPAEQENTLIYLIAHKDAAAAEASWKGFVSDPQWQKAYAESIADGQLVSNIDSVFMSPTDYSPAQ